MRQRTPSEIKAYGDGYAEAYKEFCHLLERHDKDKAIRKMKIFADAVALTVETVTDTADTPQTERSACDTCQWYNSGIPCGVEPSVCKQEVTDTPQTDCDDAYRASCDRFVVTDDEGTKAYFCMGCPRTDCPWG